MTIVTYTQGKKRFLFSVKGHAGYAKENDIVCSAISILGFTLMNRLKNILGSHVKIVYYSGEIELEALPKDQEKKETRSILDTIWMGFQLLSEQYPDYVKTERRERNDGEGSNHPN